MKFGRAGVLSVVNNQNKKKKKATEERRKREYEMKDLTTSGG
jgi:hypothetical protein